MLFKEGGGEGAKAAPPQLKPQNTSLPERGAAALKAKLVFFIHLETTVAYLFKASHCW